MIKKGKMNKDVAKAYMDAISKDNVGNSKGKPKKDNKKKK